MKRKCTLLYIIGMLFCATFCAGCGAETEVETESSEIVSSDDLIQEEEEKLPEYVTVNTEYGDLHYQYEWAEFMKTEQTQDKDTIIVAFSADIDGATYPLFQLTIGGDEEGAHGKLTDSKGNQRNVYVSMNELVMPEGLSEGEQNRLYAMQEDINYILRNLE